MYLYNNWEHSSMKSVLNCKCDVVTVTYFWRQFVVANATPGNVLNTTSQICYQNDHKKNLLWQYLFDVASTSLCLLETALNTPITMYKAFIHYIVYTELRDICPPKSCNLPGGSFPGGNFLCTTKLRFQLKNLFVQLKLQ